MKKKHKFGCYYPGLNAGKTSSPIWFSTWESNLEKKLGIKWKWTTNLDVITVDWKRPRYQPQSGSQHQPDWKRAFQPSWCWIFAAYRQISFYRILGECVLWDWKTYEKRWIFFRYFAKKVMSISTLLSCWWPFFVPAAVCCCCRSPTDGWIIQSEDFRPCTCFDFSLKYIFQALF